jgi:hypothetical protein
MGRPGGAVIVAARGGRRPPGATAGAAPRAEEIATARPPWTSAKAEANQSAASATQTSMATTRRVEAGVGASVSGSASVIARSLIQSFFRQGVSYTQYTFVAQRNAFVARIRRRHDASRDPPPSSQPHRSGAAALLTAPAPNEKPFQSGAIPAPAFQMGPVTMRSSLLTGAATVAATLATLAATLSSGSVAYAQARRATAPAATAGTAQYWMSAETTSGIAAQTGMTAQGGRPGMLGAMTGGMSRGGPGYLHNLHLELGSPRRAAGTPQADHFIPAGLNAGPSLPLVSPEAAQAVTRPYQGPGGGDGGANARIIIYFGCGEHARAGQPVEIDLSRMARGQTPPAMAQMAIQAMTGPNARNSATFGEWPNQRSRQTIPANGSLVGAHRIAGNYSPEINFSLAQGQDFLAPIRVTQNARAASGAVPVAWQTVPNATGYFLMAVGSRDANTIVMWSSSEIQFNQMGAFDYLAPAEVQRLIAQRVVLNPATTQCTVPAEFSQGLQGASLMMTAFGPEANFATPRPASAPRTWRPDWSVKLRTRSQYAGLLGQDVEAMMRGDRSTSRESSGQQQPQQRRRRGLGGIIGGVLGQ